ncbi:hypothetical protein [Nocardioides sp. Kera G14]|nr:hypothetical protein [Nocardioides sp. Kera G14]UDY23329.1 hypothetical protein LH076_14880 [Nocardioides sp. Kera G14]
MKLARIIAVTVASGAVSLGLLGLTSPAAHAKDYSWGYSVPTAPVKTLK